MSKTKQELLVISFLYLLFFVLANMEEIGFLFLNAMNYPKVLISVTHPAYFGMPEYEETILTVGQLVSFGFLCLFICLPLFFLKVLIKIIEKLPDCEEKAI